MRYPTWMAGTWDVRSEFKGYSFPSRVPKGNIIKNPNIPGFQKLSLIYLPDVGKSPSRYQSRFLQVDGAAVEDRAFNLKSVVEGYLGDGLIEQVEYNRNEPNRCTVAFKKLATMNAERIELFSNSRETDVRTSDGAFYAAECLRQVNIASFLCGGPVALVYAVMRLLIYKRCSKSQVTLGYSKEFSVARMLVCDYQNAWTFIPVPGDPDTINGELLVAGYLQS
eukprot:8614776-Pyramimonas_sp.AAC.1